MHGRHWVDGVGHLFSLITEQAKPEFNINLQTQTAFGDLNISKFRLSTYRHLKALTFQKLYAHKEFLSEAQIRSILERKII